jgi:hypothetical protein
MDNVELAVKANESSEASQKISVGSTYQFGGYDWLVLDVQDGKALLLSDKILEGRKCHNSGLKKITWEKCSLRSYLNNDFYNTLGADAKAQIVETQIINKDNPKYKTHGGANTIDKIFLLSIEEAETYFREKAERVAYLLDGANSLWWLRSPGGGRGLTVSFVLSSGGICDTGIDENIAGGIRPALWLKL